MHATRIVTFLLGAWIVGTLFVDSIVYMNLRMPAEVISGAPPAAESIVKSYGPEEASLLLGYSAGESNRLFLERWELVEIALGLILLPVIFTATDKKIIPLVLAAFLLILALLQELVVTPELALRSREVAFPPGKANVLLQARLAQMWGLFAATEGVLIVIAGALAAYVASYKSRRRSAKFLSVSEEVPIR
jgi:hypothetical protein